MEHSLRNTGKEYGAFAMVLGLIAFLYLAAEVTLYAAEVNVGEGAAPLAVRSRAASSDPGGPGGPVVHRTGGQTASRAARCGGVSSRPRRKGTEAGDGRALSDVPLPPGDDGYRRACARRRHLSTRVVAARGRLQARRGDRSGGSRRR